MNKSKLEKKSKDYAKDKLKVEFWRAAASGNFADCFFEANNDKELEKDRWLQRYPQETNESFTRRAKSAKDPDYSRKVIQYYVGAWARVKKTLEIKNQDEIAERLRNDFDSMGSSLEQACDSYFEELIRAGRLFLAADLQVNETMEVSRMGITCIPRESVWEYAEDVDGVIFIKYCKEFDEVIDNELVRVQRLTIWTREKWQVYAKPEKETEWTLRSEGVNEVGKVPVVKIDLGTDAESLIDMIARYQLDVMNFHSEIRNNLSLQCLIILGMSMDVFERLSEGSAVINEDTGKKKIRISTSSLLVWNADTKDPAKFISPEPAALEGQFKYLEWLENSLGKASGIVSQKRGAETEGAKKLDFKQVEFNLSYSRDRIQEGMIIVLEYLMSMAGHPESEVTFQIEENFGEIDPMEMLDLIIKSDAARMGKTLLAEMKKSVRGSLPVKLNSEQIKLSDAEIDSDSDTSLALNEGE